jgi:hypothetical protein
VLFTVRSRDGHWVIYVVAFVDIHTGCAGGLVAVAGLVALVLLPRSAPTASSDMASGQASGSGVA